MSFSSDPGDWYGFLIWTCLSFQILNLFRTLSSWGCGNYRPSAPFLYEVASHVKNCHSGHYYYYYYWYAPRRNLQVSSNIRCCRAFQLLKSAYLYLPDMTEMWWANSERCSMLYDELTDGSDTGWDLVWLGCDLVIEQTLMRTLKSVEQLTCCSKRSQKANTLAFMLVVKVSGEQTIESALLYQRLIVVSQSGDISAD